MRLGRLILTPRVCGLEYISNRATLHDLIFEQDRLRKDLETFGNPTGPSIVAEIAEPVVFSALAPNAPVPKPKVGERTQGTLPATGVTQEYSGPRCPHGANDSQ